MRMSDRILSFKELHVYQNSIERAMEIFQITKNFPSEEKYSMVDQMCRSSRSVCANIAEAWRKRRYKAAFIAKLSDAESEASETQVWIEFANKCKYITEETKYRLDKAYDQIIAQIIKMLTNPSDWIITPKNK